MDSEVAQQTRKKVANCGQNCWMVTTARTAMRSNLVPQLPKSDPLLWVLKNKLKVSMGKSVCFDSYINYSDVRPSPHVERTSFLNKTVKARLVKGRMTADEHYPLRTFMNN